MYDLRGPNNKIGDKALAYKLTVIGKVKLFDEYDVYSSLVLGYEILVHDLTEEN